MKNKIYHKSLLMTGVFLFIAIAGLLAKSYLQNESDSIPLSSIQINGVLLMHKTPADAVRQLGAPDRRRDFESPAFGPMTELYYGRSRLGFIDGVLQEFDIRDGRLFLTVPAGIVSVGDESAYLSELFPAAYQAKTFNERTGMHIIVLSVSDVWNGGTILLDNVIEIGLDQSGKVSYILFEQLV